MFRLVRALLYLVIPSLLPLGTQLALPSQAGAQDRLVEFAFTPTDRAQVALWVERADGTYMGTVRLTEAVALRGIGNRPGALLMNSGYHWPYGRREGVLPVWAHARAAAPGAEQFRRVIFQDRVSEGHASRSTADASRDDYFCLSFNQSTTTREALDAVSCASVFSSDKGRYVTEEDVRESYAEPFRDDSGPSMRNLSLDSLYPPRMDVARCTLMGCVDHTDVDLFQSDARRVMPEIDTVTMATPFGGSPQTVMFTVPAEWPDGDYVAYLEVNVEGDYNESYNDAIFPTPVDTGVWDFWAQTYGYAYRGQPSVVYAVPFALSNLGDLQRTSGPSGYGDLHGFDGDIRSMDDSITDDPTSDAGSGADRLAVDEGGRFRVRVIPTSVCSVDDPPAECFTDCDDVRPCDDGFICTDDEMCIGLCDAFMPPQPVAGLTVEEHPDVKKSNRWAVLRFAIPESDRVLDEYELRISRSPIVTAEDFAAGEPAKQPDPLDEEGSVQIEIPVGGAPGDVIEVVLAGLTEETTYFVAVRATDVCNAPSELATAEFTTTPITFTTVSPCYVATAAHGSAMADDVQTLRGFRDEYLMPSAVGRAFVDAYYSVGPYAADVIRESEFLRFWARVGLTPAVLMAEALQ